MAYEITIKQTTREQVKNKNWTTIGTDEDGEAERGYVEEETTEDVRREIYTQRVEELDVVKVINAVNGRE